MTLALYTAFSQWTKGSSVLVYKVELKSKTRKLCFPDFIIFLLLHAFTMVEVFNCVTSFLWFSGQSRTIKKFFIDCNYM